MKKSMFSIQQWEEIVNQYQCFNGTINQFCQTKGITKAQLYYYRKKFNNQNQDSTEFCQVTLESTKVTKSYPDTNVTLFTDTYMYFYNFTFKFILFLIFY